LSLSGRELVLGDEIKSLLLAQNKTQEGKMMKAGVLAIALMALISCIEEEKANQVDLSEVSLENVRGTSLQRVDFKQHAGQRNLSIVDYSTFLGFSGTDHGSAVTVDATGNTYLTGTSATGCGGSAYIAKLNTAGTLVYYACISGFSSPDGIGTDSAGSAYIVGGNGLLKLDPSGSSIVYSVTLGTWDLEGLAVDAAGNAYVSGSVPVAGKLLDVAAGKVNPSGTAFIYAVSFGGGKDDVSHAIAIDSAGNAYLTGSTLSTNFPTWNAFQSTLRGFEDAFVTRLNAAGTQLIYSTYLGGNTYDQGFGIAADGAGSSWIAGSTAALNGVESFPVTGGAAQSLQGGGGDAFVAKFTSTGARVYATYLGGSSADTASAIAVDKSTGSAYVTGYTQSTNFPIAGTAFQPSLQSSPDAFMTQLNPSGSFFSYSSYLGGASTDTAAGVAVDLAKNAYVVGSTFSSNFPTNVYAYSGDYDAFVTKFLGP
jgi:Beta-propeller repeat